MRKLITLAVLSLMLLLAAQAFASAKITIVNNNAPGIGFNDTTPAAPVGGNSGTTLGEQRLNAFREAARIWGQTIDSPVEISILASFEPLACTSSSAVLGSAGTIYIFYDFGADTVGFFPGPEFGATWYGAALADKRAGQDLNPGFADIRARFNSDLGKTGCLTGTFWYLGYNTANAANEINLVTVLLHEFGHGLNFQQFASVTSGAMIGNMPDIYNRHLLDTSTGKTWDQMTNAERVASSINNRRVVWTGNEVTSAVPDVLQQGVPALLVTAPSAIAGAYEVGAASFGPQLTSTPISGQLVLALDPVEALPGATNNDACSALTNAADVAGKIALVTRGTCTFTVKTKNAQNAGAIAVVVADNAAGAPPAGLGGADPTITIPSVRITVTDGNAIKAQLTGGATVSVSLGLDMSRRAGADASNRALLYTPNPVAPGSTISHYDTIAYPNQLMEPNINNDLTHALTPPHDLTLPLLHDVGWFPDGDNDGVPDNSDQCPASDLTPGAVMLGGCNTTVDNMLFSNGCTIVDLLAKGSGGNHGAYASNAAHIGEALLDAGLITSAQKDALQSCAARSK